MMTDTNRTPVSNEQNPEERPLDPAGRDGLEDPGEIGRLHRLERNRSST